jgi:predicted double-glycine peptidase
MKKIFIFLIFSNFLLSDINIYQKEFSIKKPIKSWIEFKNENLVRQEYDYSCGSAALATILKYYYNLQISEKDVLDSTLQAKGLDISNKTSLEDGQTNLSFFDLSEYANKIGFKGVGLAMDMQSLQNLQVPVILFVKVRKDEHFTVYKSMDTNYVYLADSSFGNIKVSIAKFQEMFFQRDDLKHPGKILAIIPQNKYNTNNEFLSAKNNSDFVYEIIKNNLVK